ncbi:hypothetical protein CYMTET_41060 [Cymbomonas tetramitiformis]|uniref:Reverse transcriptase domain-containing protein n=1 Tax=Cymbomonas tetramitiformis TaxID=36881 RepID=A0AAE0C902_9CHLO|nr:hypothetical protein CYMTET_41060 [Cymbomonas tetramitiformis]
MEALPLSVILTNVKQSAVRLSKFKHGATTLATEWREELLVALRRVPTWVGTLTHARREEVRPVLNNKQTKAFVSGGPGKLRMGKLIQLPSGNATPVLAGTVRKEYGAVLKMLNSTIELAARWEMEDESEGGGEGSPPSNVDEEEADSPPRRRRPPEQSQQPPSRRRPSSSPAATGKALSKITKAYHLVMTLARRVQQTPHAFGGEMEWGVRPATCPTVTQHADDGVPLDTLDDLMDADLPLEALEGYLLYLRGSAIVWHAHLLKLPDFREVLVPAETPAPEYCDLVRGADGRLSAREPVKYSKAEFAYRLIQFARTMPESMVREIHFYITYVVDLITQMSKYEVKCVVDYDKLVRQKLATGFLTTWNPDMLHATWMRFLQARVGWTVDNEEERSAKMASLLLTYLTVWNSVDLSEHGVLLEALREFESSTVGMGAAVPEVTKFADRWAVVFQDDPAVDDLVRVVPVPEGWARAIHGVGVVDKDHSNFEKVRVVHNYSENDGSSVNAGTDIPAQKWQSISDAFSFLRPGFFMVKVDIKSAYRHFPIALQYLPYHTCRWRGEVVTDFRFPFGHRAVPGKFHEVTAALVRFLRAQGFPATVGYLLDFWACCPTAAEAQEALLLLGDVLRFLGLEVAEEKCEGPVLALAERGWARRKDLERLMGQLAFASRVVVRNCREVSSSHFSVDASTGIGMGGFLDGDFFGMSWPLLREIFLLLVQWDIRLRVKWVPSKVNTFADALSRQEWQLFYQLRTEWLRDSVWRKDTDDWQLLRRVFRDLDDRPGVGPFSVDACCDESGSNAQTTNFWTVTQDCLQQDWEGNNAWCNPPFSRILEILQHFLECKRRQNVGTAACFVIPVWPTASFFKFIMARPTVFFPLANVTAKKENAFSGTRVMLKKSIRFEGRDKMRVMVNFSKTNQFSERTHETLIHEMKVRFEAHFRAPPEAEGTQQGDPLSPFFMAASLQPVLREILRAHLEVYIIAYLDDIHVLREPEQVREAYDTAAPLLADIGLELNVRKSAVFSPSGAFRAFQDIVDAGGEPMLVAAVPLEGIWVLGIPVGLEGWVADQYCVMASTAGVHPSRVGKVE